MYISLHAVHHSKCVGWKGSCPGICGFSLIGAQFYFIFFTFYYIVIYLYSIELFRDFRYCDDPTRAVSQAPTSHVTVLNIPSTFSQFCKAFYSK